MKWVPVLLLACMACSKSYTLTASLNNSRWFGAGEITEIHTEENATCLVKRFSIGIRTDLPFQDKNSESAQKVTGCVGKCSPTQWLMLAHIPLQKGTYDLAQPDTCLPTKAAKSFDSFKVGKASLLVMNSQTGNVQASYQFSDKDKGWVKVTKLNQKTGQIQGRFDLTLTRSNGQTIRFKKGKFNSKLIRYQVY